MKKIIKVLINLILISIIIFSSYNIYIKLSEYKKADNVYKHIKKISQSTENNKNKSKDNELYTINSDYKFWLKVDNTNIDYPVVQGKDNHFYLTHDFNKNPLTSGSIFMDYRNNFEKDNSIIVYGHNMRNKTMFAQLTKFKDKNFFNENNLIRIEYKNTTYIYEVFSVYVADLNNEDYLKVDFKDENDYKKYLNYIKDKSLYKKDIDLNSNDNIITLYTCSYEFKDARTIIHGKLISKT